jgi:hypothetical protein
MLSSTATNSHYIISWVLVLVPVRELVATALEEVVWELAVVVSAAVQELVAMAPGEVVWELVVVAAVALESDRSVPRKAQQV